MIKSYEPALKCASVGLPVHPLTNDGVQLLVARQVSDERHGRAPHVDLAVLQQLPDVVQAALTLDDSESDGFTQLKGFEAINIVSYCYCRGLCQ